MSLDLILKGSSWDPKSWMAPNLGSWEPIACRQPSLSPAIRVNEFKLMTPFVQKYEKKILKKILRSSRFELFSKFGRLLEFRESEELQQHMLGPMLGHFGLVLGHFLGRNNPLKRRNFRTWLCLGLLPNRKNLFLRKKNSKNVADVIKKLLVQQWLLHHLAPLQNKKM